MDVIAAFEKVKESYINYVKTAFGTQYPGWKLSASGCLDGLGQFARNRGSSPCPGTGRLANPSGTWPGQTYRD